MTVLDYNNISISSALLTHLFSFITVQDMGYKTPCWVYTKRDGTLRPHRYAGIRWIVTQYVLHRLMYALFVEYIDPLLDCDHLCRVRGCCNPVHLEAVTPRENVMRGESPTAKNATKTHCPQGHPYIDGNTGRSRNGRYCWTCRRERTMQHNRTNGVKPVRDNSVYCVNGHSYLPDNLYIRPNGIKECKTCRRNATKRWVARSQSPFP